MKYLVFFALIAVAAAAEAEAEEQTRDKRGVLGLGAYPAIPYAAPIAVGYHAPIAKVVAPIPAIKYVAPIPAVKVVQPYVSYAKIGYPSYGLGGYGLGYGLGHGLGHGYSHGYGHGFGYGHGYGYGGYLH